MNPFFDPAIERAVQAALEAHGGQTRKGSSQPYVSHPIHVAFSLIRLGCRSEVVQAGLLHDVVEDCASWTLERVANEFSPQVAAWVGELTETKGLPWEARKQAAIDKVAHMSPEAATIKAADKLHNLSTLAHALEDAQQPAAVWDHFSRGPLETLEMSERLVEVLAVRVPAPLAAELRDALGRLRGVVRS
ncbi:MAG: bifunctional (p)ppGpp synthetase/guanosine-3',5'-bis(diphosphate) 3'-pyrophosphohydrolase [Planctomycetes bacterium]|nr:bifunctional (p)ppGpp synthetase/guanosine-3',5'-bis(diphosphate) 3'-pyrophosphohydrolase [Planctomycetota bacterium]MCB9911956.1 bifunctional (p)ppGpp synthetase/guanosine-3',5'-bis(diphosphate) 3'-pyrophosphohydrolase [Planctomycetota bacterium]HPF15183.1 HD domain-containing protein [Planctomycetota bacterium]HRV80399.1 HD domain-containing protein [Planctomycetota bacterium]